MSVLGAERRKAHNLTPTQAAIVPCGFLAGLALGARHLTHLFMTIW